MNHDSIENFCGVQIPADYAAMGKEQANTVNLLKSKLLAAQRTAEDLIQRDLRRESRRKAAKPALLASAEEQLQQQGKEASLFSEAELQVSVFADSGFKLLENYGQFLMRFTRDEVDVDNTPFAAMSSKTFDTVYSGLHRPNWWRKAYGKQFQTIARLNYKDKNWRNKQDWVSAFGGGLRGYLIDLFSGNFRNRNGKLVEFDLGIDLTDFTQLDKIQLSPEVAGAIVSVLIEYLADQVFGIPYYSSAILSTHRDYRAAKSARDDATELIAKISNAVKAGALTAPDAEALSLYDQEGDLVWTSEITAAVTTILTQGGISDEDSIHNLTRSRLVARRFDELDSGLLNAIREKHAANTKLDEVQNGDSDLETAFSCYKHKVIQTHIRDVFIHDSSGTVFGTSGRDRDTGREKNNIKEGQFQDYADLVGVVTAFAATTAEKSVRSLVGGAIRGISIVSLGNEVLAEVLSAAASTLAKKSLEAITYNALVDFVTADEGDADAKRLILSELATLHTAVAG